LVRYLTLTAVAWFCCAVIHLIITTNMITSQPCFERKVNGTAVIFDKKSGRITK
jgi:hypothetical protein